MIVEIRGRGYAINPIEAARIVADRAGFDEVDAEPTGVGQKWRITAKGVGRMVTSNGESLTDAANRLIDLLHEET